MGARARDTLINMYFLINELHSCYLCETASGVVVIVVMYEGSEGTVGEGGQQLDKRCRVTVLYVDIMLRMVDI